MFTLAVLDMAGTTINEHGLVYEALRTAVEETGASVTQDDLQTWMGTDKVEAITALMRLGGQTPATSRVDAAFTSFKNTLAASYAATPPVPLPGVSEAITTLRTRGIKVALTTGFTRDVAGPLLDSLGWSAGFVDAVVTSDEVDAGRPAPYMIHRAMERTGTLSVQQVIVGGDTAVDAQAGRASGAGLVVGVLTGGLTVDDWALTPADLVIPSIAGLPAAVIERERAAR